MKHAIAMVAFAASIAMGETRVDIEAQRDATDAQRRQLDAEHASMTHERDDAAAAAEAAQAELDERNAALHTAQAEEVARREEARQAAVRADDERRRLTRALATAAEKEAALSAQASTNKALEATAASTVAELTEAQAKLGSRRQLVAQHAKMISDAADAAQSFQTALSMLQPALRRDRHRAMALRGEITEVLTRALNAEAEPATLRGLRHATDRLAALDEQGICGEPEAATHRTKALAALSLVESRVQIVDAFLANLSDESSNAISARVRQDRNEIASAAARWRGITDRLPKPAKPAFCGTLSQLGKIVDLAEVIAESRRAATGIDELRVQALRVLRATDSTVDGAHLVEQLRRSLASLPVRMTTLLAGGRIGEASLIAETVDAYAAAATKAAEASPALTLSQKNLIAQTAANVRSTILAARDTELADHQLRTLARMRSQALWRSVIAADQAVGAGDPRYELWATLRDELFAMFEMSLTAPPRLPSSMTPDELRGHDRELARSETRLSELLGVQP